MAFLLCWSTGTGHNLMSHSSKNDLKLPATKALIARIDLGIQNWLFQQVFNAGIAKSIKVSGTTHAAEYWVVRSMARKIHTLSRKRWSTHTVSLRSRLNEVIETFRLGWGGDGARHDTQCLTSWHNHFSIALFCISFHSRNVLMSVNDACPHKCFWTLSTMALTWAHC